MIPDLRLMSRFRETIEHYWELDYVMLEVDDSPGEHEEIGYMRPVPKTLATVQPAFIIQHPCGDPQKVVLQDNWITYVAPDHRRVQYLTNTEHGSSGSPVCNENWEVVALHHRVGQSQLLRNTYEATKVFRW